ncbi:MAG: DUF1761 domain-containing protein [Verrucomicrobia bacterium]|nr:DUF1761 domain-containing protein [Verrucomicrobiota bacterium]
MHAIFYKVSPIGIAISAIAYITLGILIYSQWVLGKFWPELVIHMQKQADSISIQVYLGTFFSAVLIAYGMGCLFNLVPANTMASGVLIAFIVWLAFILPTTFSPVIFGKKPLGMFWLDAVYYLITYLLIGLITAKFNSR